MRLATCTLLALLSAATLPAQLMGAANRDAPSITTTIEMANGASLTLQYTAITTAREQFLRALVDADRGATTRQQLRDAAEGAPLGSLKCDKELELAGKKIAAGEYKVAFTMDEELKWHMTLVPAQAAAGGTVQAAEDAAAAGGAEGAVKTTTATATQPIDFVLDLKDGDEERPRLTLSLVADERANGALLKVAFGKQRGQLTLRAGADEPQGNRGRRGRGEQGRGEGRRGGRQRGDGGGRRGEQGGGQGSGGRGGQGGEGGGRRGGQGGGGQGSGGEGGGGGGGGR